jgi:hypothetical protein
MEKFTEHPSSYAFTALFLLPKKELSQKKNIVHILLDKNQQIQLAPGYIQILGMGLNSCLEKPHPTNKMEATM